MGDQQDQQELTVLIYFASDNPLAPLVVSELKAIKDAGFQKDTTVLCLYDPMEKDAPTQLLDVNFKRRKAKGTFIGDGADPYVRNMIEDEVDPEEFTKAMHATVDPEKTVTAFESLESFIDFALQKRTAENYMLILLGHGMIVGNDTFLPDGDTDSAITLKELKKLCAMFPRDNKTSLKLLGLHSCSMSSIEVAYELKGTADYMLATQGTMFVNGWPYRQLLKKTFNQAKAAKKGTEPVNYDKLIGDLYHLCLYNFTDFMTAGYSCDIALCDLRPKKFDKLKEALPPLVSALKNPRVKDLILLAHWDAQSFWSENYTDLWDFCACLANRCNGAKKDLETMEENGVTGEPIKVAKGELSKISTLCKAVQDALASDQRGNSNGIVRHADNFGTEYQYARGLSIYFPWHQPFEAPKATSNSEQNKQTQSEPPPKTVLENYGEYDFTVEFGPDHSWLSFLKTYWTGTKREALKESEGTFINPDRGDRNPSEPALVYNRAKEMFDKKISKRTPELKKTPDVGADCTCPTIKNYPTVQDSGGNVPRFSITPGALGAFLPKERENEEQ